METERLQLGAQLFQLVDVGCPEVITPFAEWNGFQRAGLVRHSSEVLTVPPPETGMPNLHAVAVGQVSEPCSRSNDWDAHPMKVRIRFNTAFSAKAKNPPCPPTFETRSQIIAGITFQPAIPATRF